jgi:choline dehydrogenase-like flavoprotein
MTTTYDAIIVGSGATGGWAAKELTERGHRVLVLEAGPKVAPADLDRPPTTNGSEVRRLYERRPFQSRNRLFQQQNCHLYIDDVDHPYETPEPAPFNWIRARLVGGRTMLWNGVTFRFSDDQFGSKLPNANWPIRLHDLEPHYERVETFLRLRGTSDGVPEVPDSTYHEPAAAWPSFMSDYARRIGERLGGRRLIHQRGLGYVARSPRQANGYPWSTSPGSSLAAAEATGKLTLRPDAVVTRVVLDERTGRACAVSYLDRNDRSRHEAQARVIILAASTIETIRLLLNSATARHPQGLANSSGTLGRYVIDHVGGPTVRALGPDLGGQTAVFYVPFFRSAADAGGRSLGGYAVEGEFIPGGPYRGLLLSMQGEMLPRFENHVRLHHDRRDAWGVPLPIIDVRNSEDELAVGREALNSMMEIAAATGFRPIERNDLLLDPGTRAHELGGARMGADARSSVVNQHQQTWDVPNLFLIDGSSFVTAGFQHPTLTMLALADRSCGFIARELSHGNL